MGDSSNIRDHLAASKYRHWQAYFLGPASVLRNLPLLAGVIHWFGGIGSLDLHLNIPDPQP